MGSLDERHLRYLSAAVTSGSVRAAADKLNVNASAISRQLAQMEQELGTSLIERHSRGVRATAAGEVLLDFHRRQRSDREDTLALLAEMQSLQRGHIDIVLGEGFASELMSGILQKFWALYPGLTVTLNLASTNDVMRQVSDDVSHIGLVYNPSPEPRIRAHAVFQQPIRVIARADHPICAVPGPLKLCDLAPYRIGLMPAAYGIRQIVAGAERAEGTLLSGSITTNSIATLSQFAASTDGVTLLPAFAAAREIAQGVLVALPLAHPLLNDVEAQIITRLGRQLPAPALRLLQHLARFMGPMRQSQGVETATDAR